MEKCWLEGVDDKSEVEREFEEYVVELEVIISILIDKFE